jgi:uncharacterized RDD family membrane protein YckC/uncharacterized membrane protein
MVHEARSATKPFTPLRLATSSPAGRGRFSVIDPVELTNDIAGNAATLALPALLWGLLYLLAWEHGPFAASLGFGRRTFWLLLPGALLATLALLPIAPVSNDWLAISLAGALFPILVALLAFQRFAPPARESVTLYLVLLAVLGAASLGIVLEFASARTQLIGVAAALIAVPVVAGGVALATHRATLGRVAVLLGLTSGVLFVTFASSTAIPGVGIEELFPVYLLGPLAAGAVAAVVAEWVFPGAEGFALPVAFTAGTFGVLVGADVLRQPPLYAAGTPPGLYAIGGAGVLDLVYLSGLLAFAGAWVVHRALGRGYTPIGVPLAEPTPTPVGRLGRSFRAGLDGHIDEALFSAAAASREAAGQAHRLLGVPPAPPDRPWQGLVVPGWVVADQANLDSVAKAGSTDGREGFRAFVTARWLVLLGKELSARRFGSVGARVAAFLIDLAVVTLPAALIWVFFIQTTPGSLTDVAGNIPFNASIYGYAAVAFFYFVLLETFAGRTVGKAVLGLSVRNRALDRPTFSAAMLRNSSKLPMLGILSVGLAISLLLLLKASSGGTYSPGGGIPVPAGVLDFLGALLFVAVGVGLLGVLGVLVILLTAERQRWGDLVAGTWVVRTTPPAAVPTAPPPAPVAARPGGGPSG